MMMIRGKYFRAVDQNDQIRLSKWGFSFICRKKGWLKLFFALIELLLINIFIVALQTNGELEQDDFRWTLVFQLVEKAKQMEEDGEDMSERTRSARRQSASRRMFCSRFEGGADHHHHDVIEEYVSVEKAQRNQRIVDANPSWRVSNKCQWRKRDVKRKNDKVRNPFYTSPSDCLVCKYVHGVSKKTTKYCRECKWQSNWPKSIRAKGYQLRLHPRLCSKECFKYFHTHRIPALDIPSATRVRSAARSARRRRPQRRETTPRPRARRRIMDSDTPATITTPSTPEV